MNSLDNRVSNDMEIASVLNHHYGDGDLYSREGTPESVVHQAIAMDYLSVDGYLTRKGRDLLAQHEF